MIISGGGVRLDDIIGGTLNVGNVLLNRLLRLNASTSNLALVTVTNVITQILSGNLGTVGTADQILLTLALVGTKGATAGRTEAHIYKVSGTASVTFLTNDTTFGNAEFVEANLVWVECFSTVLNVASGGTLVVGVEGVSAGSDLSISAGGCGLLALVLRNT